MARLVTAPPCPIRHRMVFGGGQQRFFKHLLLCAFFGREKGACDRLQRHPLIYPIFSRKAGISAPFARGNLHLVIPPERDSAAISPDIRLLFVQTTMGGLYNNPAICQGMPAGRFGITIPRSCRVLLGSEPAFAGQGPARQLSPWPKPIASLSRDRALFNGCWLRTEVQHRVHSRALVLYHRVKSEGREKLMSPLQTSF